MSIDSVDIFPPIFGFTSLSSTMDPPSTVWEHPLFTEQALIFTLFQMAGRGSRNRVWMSPVAPDLPLPQSHCFKDFESVFQVDFWPLTLIWKHSQNYPLFQCEDGELSRIFSFLLLETLRSFYPRYTHCLAWKSPNDLCLKTRYGIKKIAGVLIEKYWFGSQRILKVGVGLNYAFQPALPTALALKNTLGPISPFSLLQSFLEHIHSHLYRPISVWEARWKEERAIIGQYSYAPMGPEPWFDERSVF